MTTVIDTPQGIENYRLLSLKGALKLESLGMKRRGMSVCSMVKKEFGIKGNTTKEVYQNFLNLLLQKGITKE